MADPTIAHAVKVCTRCHEQKAADLVSFPSHPPGKYGVHSLCRPCKRLDDAERRNRPDQKARQQAWRDANKAYAEAYNREYRKTYTSTEAVAAWRKRNIVHARAQESAKAKRRRKENMAYLLHCRVSARLRTMVSDKAGQATESLLGYTYAQLKRHLERQFTKGMSWDAVTRGEIHIDHILPVSSFGIMSADHPDFRVCWGLPNLRPMWAKENISKGSKRLTLL